MVGGSRKKFTGRERRAKGRVRLHRARGSAQLRKAASGSATQGLWLRNRKVGSQVSGIDRSRFPGRGTVRGGGRTARTKRKREYIVFGFDLGEREEQVVHVSALALAITDEADREAEM